MLAKSEVRQTTPGRCYGILYSDVCVCVCVCVRERERERDISDSYGLEGNEDERVISIIIISFNLVDL
jgi:hypothetical protein